ncbi:hypothetical protein ACFU44_11775 [Nocardia rhizosphaerihabitans]|uniref:hypothetical protein n=1 Tax=Nocardia rhizosphaerihabitans TaxID=1691570 RepID=UPI00366F7E31
MLIDRRLSASEVFYSPPAGVFWVDVGVHHESNQYELPTAEGVFNFIAEVDVSWRVGDPVQAVDDRAASGEAVYRPFLEQELRRISREFGLDQFSQAELRINGHFADRTIELPCGITLLSCVVKLAPESSTHSHLRQATYDRRKEQRRAAEHESLLRTGLLKQTENETRHDLALQSTRHDHEIAELEERHRLELEQLRMSFYTEALQSGDLGVLTFRLSANRDDVDDVIQLMMRQRKLDFETAHSALNSLLEQRMVNKRDVQDIMARASKIMADSWSPTSAAIASAVSGTSHQSTKLSKFTVDHSDVGDGPDDGDENDDD